jgi:hypothetical protein
LRTALFSLVVGLTASNNIFSHFAICCSGVFDIFEIILFHTGLTIQGNFLTHAPTNQGAFSSHFPITCHTFQAQGKGARLSPISHTHNTGARFA